MIRALAFRLIALVMLATIGLHAAPSSAVTIARGSGSAFDATTFEVAMQPARRIAMAAEAAVPAPPAASPETVPLVRASIETPQLAVKPFATGPPLHAVRARPSAPRAPPLV